MNSSERNNNSEGGGGGGGRDERVILNKMCNTGIYIILFNGDTHKQRAPPDSRENYTKTPCQEMMITSWRI